MQAMAMVDRSGPRYQAVQNEGHRILKRNEGVCNRQQRASNVISVSFPAHSKRTSPVPIPEANCGLRAGGPWLMTGLPEATSKDIVVKFPWPPPGRVGVLCRPQSNKAKMHRIALI
jgi:hypothetical protein